MILATLTVALVAGGPTPDPVYVPDPVEEQALIEEAAEAVPPPIPEVWHRLAVCESARDGVNPTWDYDPTTADWGMRIWWGGYQFLDTTYEAFRPRDFPARASDATPWQQTVVASRVLEAQGPGAWPNCAPRAGLTRADAL